MSDPVTASSRYDRALALCRSDEQRVWFQQLLADGDITPNSPELHFVLLLMRFEERDRQQREREEVKPARQIVVEVHGNTPALIRRSKPLVARRPSLVAAVRANPYIGLMLLAAGALFSWLVAAFTPHPGVSFCMVFVGLIVGVIITCVWHR